MRRDEALAILAAHREELHAMGVASLSLFGSVARDEAGSDSDVDVLVELSQPLGFAFFSLQQYLEQILGCPVDLATPNSLHPLIKDAVLREVFPVLPQSLAHNTLSPTKGRSFRGTARPAWPAREKGDGRRPSPPNAPAR